ISFLIASACVVFVLSLPISATKAGQTLRRWAGVLFLLALAPALFMGLVGAMGGTVAAPRAVEGGVGDLLGTVLGLVILSPVAYGILQLRKRFNPKSRDPWADYVDRKAAGKKVVDPKAAKPVLPGGTFGPFGGSP
ncbi:MAG TPA: hypothetical protein PK598_04540, partial [Thermoanaerobaculia bacterium]|nr:hypothetical protein [Thermoanaerobaculia bacterium]